MNNNKNKIVDDLFGSQNYIALANELAKAITPMKPNDKVKQRLLQSISPDSAFSGFTERLCQLFDLPEKSMVKLLSLARQAPTAPWETMGIEGIYLAHFNGGPRVASADCGFVYIDPGVSFPNHRHLGEETAFIMQGEILEDSGEIKRPGDQVLRTANSCHGFTVISDEPAILAIALYKGFEFITE